MTMNVPFLDLHGQYCTIKTEIDSAIADVHANSSYIVGPHVAVFEAAFSAFCDQSYCIGVNSGTSALEIIFKAYKPKPNAQAITMANTFFATTEAMSNAGITPVLVDCNEDDGLINVEQIEAAITEHTQFIVPVHLYGQVANMEPILAIAKKYNLVVIEDCAQAHGALHNGKVAGSFGDAAAFSFYPGKNLGAYGDAGAIVTSNKQVADFAFMYRGHGSIQKYYHNIIGDNDRMDGIQGAVLNVKLKYLEQWNIQRRLLADHYKKRLEHCTEIRLLTTHSNNEHVYHLMVIAAQNRHALQEHLTAHGIQTGIHYPVPIHRQEAYGKTPLALKTFPIAEKLSTQILSLPMYPELRIEQVDYVCDTVLQFFNSH